jgi:hypothetical protein
MSCPRCGGGVAAGQEYCLECGLRLPGRERVQRPPADPKRIAIPLALAAVVAIAGTALAIVLTRDDPQPGATITALGGSRTVTVAATDPKTRLVTWPAGKAGWTNVLISIPKVDGRDAAVARAEQARRRGLGGVGVLDSSRYGSLHPGYWIVFAGVYTSQPEAASALRAAKAAQKTARTQRVTQ